MASKVVLITVFIVDLIAFGLAVGAEQRRSTVSIDSVHSLSLTDHSFLCYFSCLAISVVLVHFFGYEMPYWLLCLLSFK
jgi:hypothetical protein